MQQHDLCLDGDTTAQDWADAFGCTWEEYVQPVVDRRAEMEARGEHMARCRIVAPEFNAILAEGGNPQAVLSFYGSDFYDRVLAQELGGPVGLITRLSKHAEDNVKQFESDAIYATMQQVDKRCGPDADVLDHGFGIGGTIFRIMRYQPTWTYVLHDITSPVRKWLAAMVDKYASQISISFDLTSSDINSTYDLFTSPKYDFVLSNEVLEHMHDPDEVIRRIARCTKTGGLLYLSTFFNDMDGHDPMHLKENNIYQDEQRWFGVVRAAGFSDFLHDPRGVLKTFERVNASPIIPPVPTPIYLPEDIPKPACCTAVDEAPPSVESPYYEEDARTRTSANATAVESYKSEGPGVGAGGEAIRYLGNGTGQANPVEGKAVLEIGFGKGAFVKACFEQGAARVGGVDIADACMTEHGLGPQLIAEHPSTTELRLDILDVSHDELGWVDDVFDVAACTETIEHVANPYYMMAEIKRVLKHGGKLVIAFPQPESNLGYGNGKHAHIYPGFLQRDSFELFMKQLYFRMDHRETNGDSVWYVFTNYKGPGMVNVFGMTSGNYDGAKLFAPLTHEEF